MFISISYHYINIEIHEARLSLDWGVIREQIVDALETGKLGLDDLAPRIQQLRGRQEQMQSRKWELETLLSDRRVELASLETVTRYVDDLRRLLEECSLTERKSFIRSFVNEVKVTGAEVLLTYTMPLPPQGISEERREFFILSTMVGESPRYNS